MLVYMKWFKKCIHITYASKVWSNVCTITGACGNKDSLSGGGKVIKFKLVLVVLPVKRNIISNYKFDNLLKSQGLSCKLFFKKNKF